ncbi:MAG: hypothetical protein K0B81_02285 [Candidatus Cloacimonetes bacterium]|nr:hypothetical protein [Candidatus Cloacimonadota bacterium]
MQQSLIHIIFAVLSVGCLYWYVFKRPVNLRRYLQWRHVQIVSSMSFSEIEEKIRKLYRNKLCINVGMTKDVFYFKDKPTLYTWGNTYIVKQGDDKQHITLYYRGSMLKWRVDKTNLSSVIFYLGGRSETAN